MSYKIKELTIRTNNTEDGIKSIYDVWKDIACGKLPIMIFENYHIISKYHNYSDDGYYDITIMTVNYKIFESIMNENINFKKYESYGDNILEATNNAWNKVYEDAANGILKRAFTEDYECSFHPNQLGNNSRDYCSLYISLL